MNVQPTLFQDFAQQSPFQSVLSNFDEMGAFEALWLQDNASSKVISNKFKEEPKARHADLIDDYSIIAEHAEKARKILNREGIKASLILRSTYNYPEGLYDATYPVSLLYARGNINLLGKPTVAVIGTRKASADGIRRAKRLARILIENKYIVISGLADGIDTVAHRAAIENGGKTIAVMGVPISRYYPTKNKELQLEIAKNHLLLSHVPILRSYQQKDPRKLNFFFPERNVIMSALSEASIIVEASDTSGTLIQAREAIKQGRKLFILESCFEKKNLKWPHKFLEKGAIRVKEPEDVIDNLGQ